MSWDQYFTLIGVLTALVLGFLGWYDKRVPRRLLSPIEEGQVSESLNKAIELANKRALDAETRVAHIEELYNTLRVEYDELKESFDIWIEQQIYDVTLEVSLGTTPKISSAQIARKKNEKA